MTIVTTPPRLAGVHHVSAVSAHIGRTHDFYTRVLGLRPVIRTVNQDAPSMYHLFFGDGVGQPGVGHDGVRPARRGARAPRQQQHHAHELSRRGRRHARVVDGTLR